MLARLLLPGRTGFECPLIGYCGDACVLPQAKTVQQARNGDAREGMRQMAKEMRDGHGATTVVEAGRKGGRTVKEKYGAVFYAQIGKKGGQSIAQERGSEY